MKIDKKPLKTGKKAIFSAEFCMKSIFFPRSLIALFCIVFASSYSLYGQQSAEDVYLFSYFMGNGDGLHWARSEDGLNWAAVGGGKSFLAPIGGENNLMRDPCVLRGPDGIFRLV